MTKFDFLMLEPTSRCNLQCYGCARNNLPNNEKNVDLDIHIIKNVLDVLNPKKLTFSGAYGESTLYKNFDELINKNMYLTIISNGCTNSKSWWEELAQKINGVVVFSLFGTEKSAKLYQKGIEYSKVIENITAYVKNGGKAVIKHIKLNSFEMKDDEQILRKFCNDLNITYSNPNFYARRLVSHIRNSKPQYFNNLTYNNNEYNEGLELLKNCIVTDLEDYLLTTEINCAWKNKGIFIDYDGSVWPCCYIKSYKNIDKIFLNYEKNFNNLYFNDLQTILNHKFFTNDLFEIQNSNSQCRLMCSEVCGKHNNYSHPC